MKVHLINRKHFHILNIHNFSLKKPFPQFADVEYTIASTFLLLLKKHIRV